MNQIENKCTFQKKNCILFSCAFLLIFTFLISPVFGDEPPRNSGGAWVFYKNATSVSQLNLTALRLRVREMRDRGSQYIRLWIPWSQVETSSGNWNFTRFQQIISAIVTEGQKLNITLCTVMSPTWYHSIINQSPNDYLHVYYDPVADAEYPETSIPDGKHALSYKSVTSPHISIWSQEARTRAQTFVNRSFSNLLNKWAPYISFYHLSMGRLNEPLYPSSEDYRYFMCYDNNAKADFRTYLQNQYATISALNSAWGTSYSSFSQINPPKVPFSGLNAQHKYDFILWYRISKRNWIIQASNYVTSKLNSWQKYIIYTAGPQGEVDGTLLNTFKNSSWDSLSTVDQNTLITMRDNRWILLKCQYYGWYSQYAGIGETCTSSSLCQLVPVFAGWVGYTGPIFGQIPGLNESNMNQPYLVASNVISNGYYGLHWNKDENLFDRTPGTTTDTPNARMDSLEAGWDAIKAANPSDDYTPPSINSISSSVSGLSATINWTTNENADSCIIYGTNSSQLYTVGPFNQNKTTSHSITLNNLSQQTTYYYRVTSSDSYGNLTTSALKSFSVLDGRTQVSIDMGLSSDIKNGIERPNPEPGDGQTIGQTITNSCNGVSVQLRKNRGTNYNSRYLYFKVDDTFIKNGSHSNIKIRVQYWDRQISSWSNQFSLQYDSISSGSYKYAGSVTVGNTKCMKTADFNINDAYFGNRENGGSDFRIYCGSGDTRRYINVVTVYKQ